VVEHNEFHAEIIKWQDPKADFIYQYSEQTTVIIRTKQRCTSAFISLSHSGKKK